jgi:hypothetical protein
MKTFAVLAAMAATLAIAPIASAEPGQNGPPGPEGNPNQPPAESAPAPGPPTTPPGNSGNNPHGGPPGITGSAPPATSNAGGGGQSPAAPAPTVSHPTHPTHPTHPAHPAHPATPASGTAGTPQGPPADAPVASGTTNNPGGGPDGKITICHSTGSDTNPYVEITISVNGLNGHGGHHDGADIIPAPAGGCPGAATTSAGETTGSGSGADAGSGNDAGSDVRSRSGGGPSFTPAMGYEGVLGAVLSESASGGADPAAGTELAKAGFDGSAEANEAGDAVGGGSLPFTGMKIGGLALFGLLALCGGVALWRVTRSRPDSV